MDILLYKNTKDNRTCSKCREYKPLNEENFHKSSSQSFGFAFLCKECENKRCVEKTNNETVEQKEYKRKRLNNYRKTNIGKAVSTLSGYLTFDKERGFYNNLDRDYILLMKEKTCIYCDFSSTGLDRLDNTKGHTKENCVPCCKECNIARMDNFTYEEMLIIGIAIREVKLKRNKQVDSSGYILI